MARTSSSLDTPPNADSASPLWSRHLRPLAMTLLVASHGVIAHAADIAKDTPAASMALATGLYATPGPSAAVSTVKTPNVTSTPLPTEAPPTVVAQAASPGPAVPVVAAVPPGKLPDTTGWINYVAVIASLVGAIAGIAGMVMGGIALRRVSRRRRY
jgi:hypothetical protein